MIPLDTVSRAFRRRLAFSLLVLAPALASADVYISPTGGGNYSGDQSNPKPAGLLQNEIVTLQPGNTIYILPGTYSTSSLSIVGSGTAIAPKRIIGIADGSGNLPRFVGTYDVHDASGAAFYYVFKFVNYGGAETSHWEFKNLRFEDHGHVIDMPLNGDTFTLRRNILFENLEMDNIEDGIRLRNAENVTVRGCSIIRHTKKAFRIGFYTRFITFEDCDTDANGGDNVNFPTRSIPVGFGTDSPGLDRPVIHNLRFIGCSARNNRFKNQGSNNYWNGDGYSTERGVYNVTYSRCTSIDNHDGGWDDKAVNVIYENCIAIGNKRGFRSWSTATLINCLSVDNKIWAATATPSAPGSAAPRATAPSSAPPFITTRTGRSSLSLPV